MYSNRKNICNVNVVNDKDNIEVENNYTSTQRTQSKKYIVAKDLPTIAVYNMRSMFPKIDNLIIDILERKVDIALLCEIWENEDNVSHQNQIEKMLELHGLKYISSSRPPNYKGVSYGGAAMIVNLKKFQVEKIPVFVPNKLEVVWGLVKPKNGNASFKRLVVCSFYSPPSGGSNSRMADHLTETLQVMTTRYPDCGLIMGGDKNRMNIRPLLNCGLQLKQCVDKPTRQGAILDIIIMNLYKYYNSPIIVPPIAPDNPLKGVPSDHSIPLCSPYTDKVKPPERNYRTINYRPLPDSKLREFGTWLVTEDWSILDEFVTPTEKVEKFESTIIEKLDSFCPVKSFRVSSQDKPWINAELKRIDRLKNREYLKRGKSEKYKELAAKFSSKYKIETQKYLRRNLDDLKDCKPGQAYSVLKRMGAMPGDCVDKDSFTLPNHAGLTNEQSAEKIADYFAQISQEYPPLDIKLLPSHVIENLSTYSYPPTVTEHETYRKIVAAKKPKSGVPGDIPRGIVSEFAPELARPACMIINSIVKSGEWPVSWKNEWITPISKIPAPETENDLRPISLTPFFSKVAEKFVVDWLLSFIKDKIDFRQYGGMKGSSISHYLIEFISFILMNQDNQAQTAVLACMVDYQKAFNRQNHNILITKLSDMGVPSWLLKVVMGFLSSRKMSVRFNGKTSSWKELPGGGPQGTLLGLLLFLVLINEVGFEGQVNNTGELLTSKRNIKNANMIHLKYIDDLTLAESIDLIKQLVHVPEKYRNFPDVYHGRTGHILPHDASLVQAQLKSTQKLANSDQMKINIDKTKAMLFNQCRTVDFMPNLSLDNQDIEVVEQMKLLGVIITSDLKWSANTEFIVKKAFKKLWVLRRLKEAGANRNELIDMYVKIVRSIVELAVPVWHSSLMMDEIHDIERVQKCALRVILGDEYQSYPCALKTCNLESLEMRRDKLCTKFALKAEKHAIYKNWFKVRNYDRTRLKDKYEQVRARTERLKRGPISNLVNSLNDHYRSLP